MAEQLRFDLSVRPALGREAFFISEANALALAMLDDWRNWPGGRLLLIGPSGAGKTHLAHVWAAEAQAQIVNAQSLETDGVDSLLQGPICIEDVHLIAGDDAAQTALFHLYNLALAEGRPLLLTAQDLPDGWGLSLRDLVSRLQGAPVARIEPPDEALLGAVFTKLFLDRQIAPKPEVLAFLARHAPRRFDVAQLIVDDMDDTALSDGTPLTIATAKSAIQRAETSAG